MKHPHEAEISGVFQSFSRHASSFFDQFLSISTCKSVAEYQAVFRRACVTGIQQSRGLGETAIDNNRTITDSEVGVALGLSSQDLLSDVAGEKPVSATVVE